MKLYSKLLEKLYLKVSNNLALYCQQTKLYNKNWWYYIAIKKYKKVSVYVTMIDIDNFKEINDTKGHVYGDKVIGDMANVLKSYIDGDLVHYGGDEFVILTFFNPLEQLQKINQMRYLNTISFGTYKKSTEETLMEALDKADHLMYSMKN